MSKENAGILLAKLGDACHISIKRPSFVGFLNEHEVAIAEDYLRYKENSSMFWGGHSNAERKILGVFPEFIYPEVDMFPLKCLSFLFREQDVLSHRDFLGAFMSLGIQRSTIGDIMPENGRCVVFLREEIVGYVQENVRKIGNVGVRIVDETTLPLPPSHAYQNYEGVIASKRLDCITAFLCRMSREKSVMLIRNGFVMVNHREVLLPSAQIGEGDILSIKQKGKFLIDQFGPLTGKGRIIVRCRKYI